MKTTKKRISNYVFEDLLFRRRLQRSLNAEYEKLSALLVQQVKLLKERDALMDGIHAATQERWQREEAASNLPSAPPTEEVNDGQ
jgi:hypothetical protein